MYLSAYGIAPYFKSLLKSEVDGSPILVISFDESLNQITETCEKDVIARDWDINGNTVKVRYRCSAFFGHAKHDDLFKQLNETTKELDQQKLYQISIGGLSVNWKFYGKVVDARTKAVYHKLIGIGSCSLHIVQGSLNTAVDQNCWKIKKVLKDLFTFCMILLQEEKIIQH